MKVSLLNVRITFQRSSVTIDSIGNNTLVWSDERSFFATVSSESPGEKFEGNAELEDVTIAFTVRYCEYIAGISSLTHRIKFKGEAYDILGIDHQNYKKKSVKFLCRKERPHE